nr:putative fbd-associated f-box protein [Quercus suber]
MPLLLTLTLSALCRTLASPTYSPISQFENLSPQAFCRAEPFPIPCPSNPFNVDTWVRAAIPHGLKELCLNICNDTVLEFPRSVFFSTTLVALKLAGNFALNPPSNASFPSLRILHLALLNYANSESLSAILNACPVLQDFISSFKVHINTPALKYLIFKGHLIEDVVLENLSHLVALVLQVEIVKGVSIEDDAKRVWDLIRPLAHVKSLSLSTKTTEILCHAFGDNVPMFHNLFSLKFNGCLYFEWHAIRFLFGRAPKLQILAFESCPEHSYGQPTPDSSWEEPLDVPECLSSHLTTCHYKGFLGNKDEMQLVRQILKVARVLKTLKITVDGHLESEEKLCVRKAL